MTMASMGKRCPDCARDLPASAFRRRWKDRPTLQAYCRDCMNRRRRKDT